ncbi:hypothetical protein [Klebsiella pneumoniae]|uniref:hypothetical protein n=1 Tax=Klebsiella pneumoniae TaxID=573 RepID=UPI0013D56165|nr:hypothetical protein [Klebsiella pneumoniae]
MGKLIEISATHSVAADNIAELYLLPGEAVVVVLRNGNHLPVDLNDGESLYDGYRRLLVEIQTSLAPESYVISIPEEELKAFNKGCI